jgi:hypothetical protein
MMTADGPEEIYERAGGGEDEPWEGSIAYYPRELAD